MELDGWTIDCVAGQRTEAVVDMPTGKLSIQLPPEWILPDTGSVQVMLVDAQERARDLFAMNRTFYLKDGQRCQGLASSPAMTLDLVKRRIECRSMPVGTFDVQVELFEGTISTNGEGLFGGSDSVVYMGGEQQHSSSKSLAIEASTGSTVWEVSVP
ncbi:MAG: hypothetical protein GY930_07805 [bacterium]|nr:hypothetical protein [bacterium]